MNIPPVFFETDDPDPFHHCISCNRNLKESKMDFMIEKAVRNFPDLKAHEVIFEYAICTECALKARHKLSKESREAIEDFLSSDAVRIHNIEALQQGLQHQGDATKVCMVTGERMENTEEYQIFAHCRNGELVENSQAFMLSGKALEMITELLSEETKDELDRFRDDFFGLPPELHGLIDSKNLVFL